MPKFKKQNLIAVLVIVFIICIGSGIYFYWSKTQSVHSPLPEQGEIGELSEEEIAERGILPKPKDIFNTGGTILKIEKDGLIVKGKGINFADGEPRDLKLIFTDSTIVFEQGTKVRHLGLECLNYLKVDQRISIGGAENIRGKTEFKVRTINVIL